MVINPTSPPGTLRLQVLCVLADPADMPRFDVTRAWCELDEALRPFQLRGSLTLQRIAEPTENALRRNLADGKWDVLHMIVHSQDRSAARYGTIALQSSDGRARNLAAEHLATLLDGIASLKLVVLQGCDEASSCFDTAAEALIEHGLPAVAVAPPLTGRSQQIFLSKLYAGVLAGLNTHALSKEVLTAMTPDSRGVRAFRFLGRDTKRAVFTLQPPHAMPVSPGAGGAISTPQPPLAAMEGRAAVSAWQEGLEKKRALSQFDVFLCHNSADKPAVKRVGQQLKEAGILPWLDVWELPPGQPWQSLLERQIGNIRSAAVFVGSAGIGPWQEQEMYSLLREFVGRKAPVIPVLLPDAPSTPELPIFLRAMTWVDFRADDPDPLERLIWGITGNRPNY